MLVCCMDSLTLKNEEIRKGEYIVTETQQIGEKAIRYYENINIFFMKFHHEEYVR